MWLHLLLSLIVLGIILLHVFIPKKYKWPSTWRKLNKIPGPWGLPYFGNTFSFLVSAEEFIPTLVKFTDKYGPIWKTSIQGTVYVFLCNFDDIEIILNSRSHITKGEEYEFLLPWLGTGLLISSGKKWSDHRKWLTPAFHFAILEKQYIEIMNRNAEILAGVLQNQKEGAAVDINSLISDCTLDIICETAMGVQINAQLRGENQYVKSVLRMSQIFTKRLLSPWLYRPFIFYRTPLGRDHERNLKIVHEFTRRVIKERQEAFMEKQNAREHDKSEDLETDQKKKISFLDLLIEISKTQNRLTEEEIQEEVNTFMFEGHDTTAAALLWAFYELGLHPEIQERAYQEQCEIFQGSDREPTFADLQGMKYLERIIKETLRLYPSVPIITRTLMEDLKIRNYEIPAGTLIPIFIYYIHRHPKFYPDPEKFNPDRFLPDLLRDRHPYSYIPFSAGPRNCIGQRFAMMELKIVLSRIIRQFKIANVTKPEDVKIMGEIILRSKENIKMSFTQRNKEI